MRVGIGYDIHRLVKGRRLILGGVEIPFKKGLIGHSDADVLLHAVMDAILGAAALGDIGQHFPNTDPRYKDVSSIELLREVVRKLEAGSRRHEAGSSVLNIDAIVIAEAPKIGPHIQKMRENIAEACGIPVESISIKATTNEGVGAVGRGEAIAAQAVVLLNEVSF